MEPVEELRYLILAAQREGNRMLSAALRPLGLTPAQAEVLRVLQDFEPLTLAELGGLLVCESGSPSRLVEGMVRRSLVKRAPSKDDGRAVRLQLLPAGRKAVAQVAAVEAALRARISAAVDAKRLDGLVHALRGLVGGSSGGEALARRRSRVKAGKAG